MAYQDTWIKGKTVEKGDRSCADRYDVIRQVIARYTRPVTVWDLGANRGYVGCRLADEFGAVSVMVEPRTDLVDVCRQNAIPTTIAMTHRLTPQDLSELSVCVHADVILALNVLHHMADPVAALASVLQMGTEIIIETPGRGDRGSANYGGSQRVLDQIEAECPEQLETFPSHVTPGAKRPMFYLRRVKSFVSRGYVYGARVRKRGAHPTRPHVIRSTYAEKTIAYEGGESRAWHPGVNLWNWAQLGGSYPSRADVQRAAVRAYRGIDAPHGDLRPWNLILQGQSVQVIDAGHRLSVDDATGIKDTLKWIAAPALAYVQ
jgi:hypothetical protein